MTEHQMTVFLVTFYTSWIIFTFIGLSIWKSTKKAFLTAVIICAGFFVSQSISDKIAARIQTKSEEIVYKYDKIIDNYTLITQPAESED